MTDTLAGELLDNADIEVIQSGTTIEILIRCDSLSGIQLAACNESIGSDTRVLCTSGTKTYVGKCIRVCCLSCGTTCHLMGCTVSA
jgi:hypothetical protein